MTALAQILSLLMVVCGILLLWGCSTSSVRAPLLESDLTPTLIAIEMPLHPFDGYLSFNWLLTTPFFHYIDHTIEPPTLSSPPPTCYPQPQGGWVCLGRVINNSLSQVQHTALTVMFGNQKRLISPEQHSIASGSFAPYRARFEVRGALPAMTLISNYSLENTLVPNMELTQEEGNYVAGRGYGIYDYRAQVAIGDRDVIGARLTVTLLDEQQHVVAYRTQDLPSPLTANSETPVAVSLIPQTFAEQFSVIATLTLK